jgi:hypothetical protein
MVGTESLSTIGVSTKSRSRRLVIIIIVITRIFANKSFSYKTLNGTTTRSSMTRARGFSKSTSAACCVSSNFRPVFFTFVSGPVLAFLATGSASPVAITGTQAAADTTGSVTLRPVSEKALVYMARSVKSVKKGDKHNNINDNIIISIELTKQSTFSEKTYLHGKPTPRI